MFIRRMTAADIPFALRLCAQNNWNQQESDWRRQLDLEPDGCFVACESEPVGAACCCVFGDIAWINFVLVDEQQRNRGFGTALMRHVLQHLDERRVTSIRLDATPLGRPVYEKLGFAHEFTLARYAGTPRGPFQVDPNVEPLRFDDLPAVFALDEAVTQTRRDKLLQRIYEETPAMTRKHIVGDRLDGYCLARPGRLAWQIGPLQGSLEAARQLAWDAARRFAGQQIFMDVPAEHVSAVQLAESMGLRAQRCLDRMGRGRRVVEDLSRFWSSFGPEKG